MNSVNSMCLFFGLACTLMLSGCGGSTSKDIDVLPDTVPTINPATAFSGPLHQTTTQNASRFIKNGIYSSISSYQVGLTATPEAGDASGGFSTTNTQESGVDEADRIEYDGSIMYVASFANWVNDTIEPAHVRVMRRNEDFSLSQIATLDAPMDDANISGLYLADKRLAVLSAQQQYYVLDSLSIAPWVDFEQNFTLQVYDVSQASEPSMTMNVEFDGGLIASRRIGQELYLLSSYVPHVEGLNSNPSTDAERLANYLKIVNTPDSQLMPKMYIDGNPLTLNTISDCAIPVAASNNDGYAQLLTLVRINLEQTDDISARCIATVAEELYMSSENVYISASLDNKTLIHKLALDSNLSYQASGSVEGVLGFRGQRRLRMSEKDGYLRIVTTDFNQQPMVHSLSVLSQQGSELQVQATLPNAQQSEPIGKPGEDIFAVRFFNERAYIVTFERIDPLYVIDLSDPMVPQVAGTLEIPGFSSYLHPLDNNYLLGVGQQVPIENLPNSGEQPSQAPTQQGMKVSLFDVSDPSNPIEINSVVKERAYTPIEWDYRALAVLQNNGAFQFAMPVEQWGQTSETDFWYPNHNLLLLEVDTQAASPLLIERAEIRAQQQSDYYIYGGEDRSVIHDEHIYYLHGNSLWHALWQDQPNTEGPY